MSNAQLQARRERDGFERSARKGARKPRPARFTASDRRKAVYARLDREGNANGILGRYIRAMEGGR